MKYLFSLLFLFPFLVYGQSIHFIDKTPLEAITLAKSTGKYVFVDFGATWCRPCLMLEQGTFKDDSVASFFNRHFVSVHIDADKQAEWVKYYKVPTYPHLLIMNEKGESLWAYTSYVDAAFLLRNAKLAIGYFEEKYLYEKNPKNAAVLRRYLETFPRHSDYKDTLQHIVQRFLVQFQAKEWLQSPQWELIQDYITTIELPEYQYLLNHASGFSATEQQKLEPYIYEHLLNYKNTILKKPDEIQWQDYKNYYLTALQQFKTIKYPKEYYLLQMDLTFYAVQKDETAYLTVAKEFLNLNGVKEAKAYADVAMEVIQNFRPLSPLWVNAEEWAKKAVELDGFSMYPNYVYAYVKMRRGDLSNALKLAEKANSVALDASEKQQVAELITKINQKIK